MKAYRIISAGDYCVLQIGEYEFYYGYERTRDEEWLFEAKKKDEVIMSYTAKELGAKPEESLEWVLLRGIASFMYSLVEKTKHESDHAPEGYHG